MSKFQALRDLIGQGISPYTPTVNPFLKVDVDAMARQMELEEKGKARGAVNLPPPNGQTLDDIESEIAERIEDEARQAYIECTNELRVVDGRIAGLDLMRRFAQARAAADGALADFDAAARAALNRLAILRKHVFQYEQYLEEFKKANGLTRPVHEAKTGIAFWGFVIGAVVVEAGFNSVLLRVNDDYGFLGGVTIAFVIASINVFIATMFGKYAYRYVNHIKLVPRLFGWGATLLYLTIAVSLNLVGAHYRDVKGMGATEPGVAAIKSFVESPFSIHDFMSGLLFVLGMAASILAFIVGYRSDDEYPGYGRVGREHQRIQEEYSEGVEDAQSELASIRDTVTELAQSLRDALAKDRREYQSAILSRNSLIANFGQQHPHLETAGNRLLQIYRSANQAARTEAPPAHFQERWQLAPMSELTFLTPPPLNEIDGAQRDADTALQQALQRINDIHGERLRDFKQIDDLVENS